VESSTTTNSQRYPEKSYKLDKKPMMSFKNYVTEVLKKFDGKWALVSKKDPAKVLQYYKGSGKPSQEWVDEVEKRIQYFKYKGSS
jgi:hypothetical protein